MSIWQWLSKDLLGSAGASFSPAQQDRSERVVGAGTQASPSGTRKVPSRLLTGIAAAIFLAVLPLQAAQAQLTDLMVTATDNPDPVNIGQNLTYQATVSNNGSGDASDVNFRMWLNGETGTFVSATSSQGSCTSFVECDLGDLAAGASATVDIVVFAVYPGNWLQRFQTWTVDPETGFTNDIDDHFESTTVTNSSGADLLLAWDDVPDPATLGSQVTWTATVTNQGPEDSTGVIFAALVPQNVTLGTVTPAVGTCDSLVVCQLGDLADGESTTVTVTGTVNALGTLTWPADVVADQFDPSTNNSFVSATTEVDPAPGAELSVTLTDTPDPVGEGLQATYTATVANNNPLPEGGTGVAATGVVLDALLPPGVTLVSATPSQGSCDTLVECQLGTIPADGTATVDIVVTAGSDPQIVYAVSVSANESDALPENNTAGALTAVIANPPEVDMTLTVNGGTGPVTVGEIVDYAIRLQNLGPETATSVRLLAPLPAGTSFVAANSPLGSCDASAVCTLGTLAPGAEIPVDITVRADLVGPLDFTFTATSGGTELDPANDSLTNSTTVQAAPGASADLGLTVAAAPDPVRVDESLSYGVVVANAGPDTAEGVVLTATPPAGAALTLVTVAPGQGSCDAGQICALGDIESGESVLVTVVATADGAGQVAYPFTIAQATGDPNPANDAATATVEFVETVVLSGARTLDPREREIQSFVWTLVQAPAGSAAALDDATIPKPSFTIDLAGDYVFELVVNIGNRSSAPDQVAISTENSAPVAAIGPDRQVAVGQAAQLDGAGSWDMDGDGLGYAWTMLQAPAGSAAAISDPAAPRPFLTPDLGGDYVVQLVVNDGDRASAPARITVTTESNLAPTLAPGLRATRAVGTSIVLTPDAVGDLDGDDLGFDWSVIARPAGSSAGLTDPNALRPSLNIDVPGTYIVQLVADDGPADSQTTAVIDTLNTPPVADAGADRRVAPGDEIDLDGAASHDVDGDPLTYEWALLHRPAESFATLADTTLPRPHFTVDATGTYVLQLTVSDGGERSVPATVTLSTSNATPVADAGPDQVVGVNDTVQLDAGASTDPDGDVLSYRWTMLDKPNGPGGSLSADSAPTPTFEAKKAGDYLVGLTVSDGFIESPPDTVLISTTGVAPLADAGPDVTVSAAGAVPLDGSASADAGGEAITYAWALLSQPDGAAAVLAGTTTATPGLTLGAVPGDYVVQLIVDDGTEPSRPDTIVVTRVNNPPVADAGPDQSLVAGTAVILDGSASSDPDGQTLSYAWTLESAPEGSLALLSDATTSIAGLDADLAGDFTLTLTVSDGFDMSSDTVTITASAPPANVAPTLAPIGDQSVALGTSLAFTLAATDPNGTGIVYSATPLPLPDGASLDGTSGEFAFTPNEGQVGDIVLTFFADDGLLIATETITITVTGPPPGQTTDIVGRVLDTNAYTDPATPGLEVPIIGAAVRLLGGGPTVTTDSQGNFTLADVAAGTQVIDIDASTALPAPDGQAYASFREPIGVIDGVENVIERPLFLPRIDPSGGVVLDTSQVQTVSNPAIGVSLELNGAEASFNGGDANGITVTISEVPRALAPVALPEDLDPGVLYTVQPVGLTFSSPQPITFPNTDGLPAGVKVDIWAVDVGSGQFTIVGQGQVSADETKIDTISGGLTAATWCFPLFNFLFGPNDDEDNGDNPPCDCGEQAPIGSSGNFASGNLSEDHRTASHRSFGQSRDLRFVYNSEHAAPRPVVSGTVTLLTDVAIPQSMSHRLRVAGVNQGEALFTSTAGLNEEVTEQFRQSVQFDATEFDTGIHRYSMSVTGRFGIGL